MTVDQYSDLTRAARLHGWTEHQQNRLGYYNLKFTRPESDGRESVMLLRVNRRIVEMQCEIAGLKRSYTMPAPGHVREVLSAKPPRPTAIHPASDAAGHDLTSLRAAVDNWDTGLDSHGHALHRAASDLLRRLGDGDE